MKQKIIVGVIVGLIFTALLAGACYFYLGDLLYRSGHVLTLKDFSDDDSLRAGPANFVVVAFWQTPTDVGEGEPVAVIPCAFPYDSAFSFCWETGAATFDEYMMLHYANGREVLRVDAGGECVTEVLPRRYVKCVSIVRMRHRSSRSLFALFQTLPLPGSIPTIRPNLDSLSLPPMCAGTAILREATSFRPTLRDVILPGLI